MYLKTLKHELEKNLNSLTLITDGNSKGEIFGAQSAKVFIWGDSLLWH